MTAQWDAIGLRAVLLQDHADAAQIIRELRHLEQPGYIAPQRRARRVWEAHVEHFDDLQDAYSDRLAAAADRLRLSFGCEQINLTLWLADGSGGLARWATQDRYHRDCAGLRTVPTGHDSHWIAGKALGSESTLFQYLHGETTGRWCSVLALPIAVTLGPWPQFVTAVLSVGLPETAHAYERTALL